MNPQEINPTPNQINQDPNPNQINTNTAPNTPIQPTMTPSEQVPVQSSSDTDILGILSLVLAFIGLAVIGLILGIIGIKKAKNEGRSTTLSKIGIILNIVVIVIISLIFFIAVIAGYNSAKNTAEKTSTSTAESTSESLVADTTVIDSANLAIQKLEEFYNEYGYYPETIQELVDLGEIDASTVSVLEQGDYEYSSTGCVNSECSKYSFTITTPEGRLVKLSLN